MGRTRKRCPFQKMAQNARRSLASTSQNERNVWATSGTWVKRGLGVAQTRLPNPCPRRGHVRRVERGPVSCQRRDWCAQRTRARCCWEEPYSLSKKIFFGVYHLIQLSKALCFRHHLSSGKAQTNPACLQLAMARASWGLQSSSSLPVCLAR